MTLKIINTAYEGYGIGRDKEDKIVFVERAVEGDTVEVEITESKKNFSFAKIKNVISPSEFRIESKCEYAKLCGGCLFSHIDYNKQILIKEKILRDSLRKFLSNDTYIKIFSSEKEDYRLRANFVAENGKIGFYGFKTKNFVAVKNCVVIKKSMFEKAREFIDKNNIDGRVYILETDSGVTLVSVDTKQNKIKDKCSVDTLKFNGKIFGNGESFYNTHYGKIGVGTNSFFQANRFLLNIFQKEATDFVKEKRKNILELYAGSGFFTAGLITKSENVFAYEIDYKSVNLGKKYGYPIEKSDSKNVESILEKNKTIKNIDTIFLDPPREGVSKEVINMLIKIKAENIIYVSCNPMTLSRDIALLNNYYKIKDIKMFDMFPDTYHIESVVLLEKSN